MIIHHTQLITSLSCSIWHGLRRIANKFLVCSIQSLNYILYKFTNHKGIINYTIYYTSHYKLWIFIQVNRKLDIRVRAVHQPIWPSPPIWPNLTWRPTDKSECPYRSCAGQLILIFSFSGRFWVPWLLNHVNQPIWPRIFKKKTHDDGSLLSFIFRKISLTFSNLSLKSLT